MVLGRKKKAQQRRRLKIAIEQFCCILAKQIANAFWRSPWRYYVSKIWKAKNQKSDL